MISPCDNCTSHISQIGGTCLGVRCDPFLPCREQRPVFSFYKNLTKQDAITLIEAQLKNLSTGSNCIETIETLLAKYKFSTEYVKLVSETTFAIKFKGDVIEYILSIE